MVMIIPGRTDTAALLRMEDLFLHMIDIITESGTSVAFPSQVHYIAQDPGLDAARTRAAEAAVETWRSEGPAALSRLCARRPRGTAQHARLSAARVPRGVCG